MRRQTNVLVMQFSRMQIESFVRDNFEEWRLAAQRQTVIRAEDGPLTEGPAAVQQHRRFSAVLSQMREQFALAADFQAHL